MSDKTVENRRFVRKRVVLSPNAPRVNVWSPITSPQAFYDMVASGSDIQKIYIPNQSDFFVPDRGFFSVNGVYSDEPIMGFGGDRNVNFIGVENAAYVVLVGSVLRKVIIQGKEIPAETRYAMMQTRLNPAQLLSELKIAAENVASFRYPRRPDIYRDFREVKPDSHRSSRRSLWR